MRNIKDKESGRQRWHKEGRTGEGEALFRQPDNIPSPEHICGCPLTPSRRSLWRQSKQLWPACRFPIISLAEGSGLPIHQQVWTCKLWWQSIRRYTNHTTKIPGIKYFTFTHNTLIISTRSVLATRKKKRKKQKPWSQGILITLLVKFHWRKRSLVGCIVRGQISAKAPSAKSYISLACSWEEKLNDANWFYSPNKLKTKNLNYHQSLNTPFI